jgi:predicted nucleic acid-binding protein
VAVISSIAMIQMTMTKIAIDTNIMLYSLDDFYPEKQRISRAIIASHKPLFCSQNLSEFLNVCLRRLKIPKSQVCSIAQVFLNECVFFPVTRNVTLKSFQLVQNYDFQVFDAIIVAAAMDAGCRILYSEDMQHQQIIEKTLTVINPFI